MEEISVVIPVYNAEGCLQELCKRLTAVLPSLTEDYEIVLIDDRSQDRSWQVMADISKENPRIRSFRLSRNFGQHAAITAGLAQSNGQKVVVMDCDLQDPPEMIPSLYRRAEEGFDVVLARRQGKRLDLFRKLTAKLYFGILNRIAYHRQNGEYGSFSMISRKVVEAFLRVPDHNRHYLFIINWLGFNATFIDYEHAERYSGKSSYTLKALIDHGLEGLFFQTTTLLRWIVYLGFTCSIVGVLVAVYFIYRYFSQSALPGWTSLVVVFLSMGGIILICLGVVGLYVGQVFEQVKGRPLYIIDQSSCE